MKVLSKQRLVAHPDVPAPAISIGAKLSLLGTDVLVIEYAVVGALDALLIPPPGTPEPGVELWKHSCFELFVGTPRGNYAEFNFAPSRQWASYRFEGYRAGMHPAVDLAAPMLFPERTSELRFGLTAILELAPLLTEPATRLGVSAVIEANDGSLSYWALAHPPGKPDFHDPACFALELPAAV